MSSRNLNILCHTVYKVWKYGCCLIVSYCPTRNHKLNVLLSIQIMMSAALVYVGTTVCVRTTSVALTANAEDPDILQPESMKAANVTFFLFLCRLSYMVGCCCCYFCQLLSYSFVSIFVPCFVKSYFIYKISKFTYTNTFFYFLSSRLPTLSLQDIYWVHNH